MKTSIRRRLAAGKRRIEKRLDKGNCQGCDRPMLRPANIQYELAERTRGMTYGGIGSASTGAGNLFYTGAITPNIVTGNGITPQLTTASTISTT